MIVGSWSPWLPYGESKEQVDDDVVYNDHPHENINWASTICGTLET